MADIRAFRAFRYDLGRTGSLSDVVAPPYDVIDAAMHEKLLGRSPYNIVRVDLGRDEPGDDANRNRYTRSAQVLRDWIQSDVVRQDSARGLYVCHQQFAVDGQTHVRRGFFAQVRLEPLGSGQIFAHEETMSGPKEDRLRLMRATGMNLSPVFSMYPGGSDVQSLLDNAVRQALPTEATDDNGVVSRLWPITDQAVVSQVIGLLGPKPLFIADGHHRYETSLKYLSERQAAGEVPNADAPPHFTLMLLVGMDDAGLIVQPTHRLLSGLGSWTSADWLSVLSEHFELQPAVSATQAWEMIQAMGTQELLGFGGSDGQWVVGRFLKPAAMYELAAEHSPAWRQLAVSVLHRLVIDRLLQDRRGQTPTCGYVHRVEEVVTALKDHTCDAAVLVPPVSVHDIEEIAGHRETMPAKSTYFYPKVLTGLLLNSVSAR